MGQIKKGQWAIGLVCIILGLMIAVQFRTTSDIKESLGYQRMEDLTLQLNKTEKERAALQEELGKLRTKLANGEGVSGEVDKLRMEAGLTEVAGPGVTLILDDSKRSRQPGENPNLYLIHDDDLLKVINELRAAGAEAISINDQRLLAMSEIRCAGPTLSVNNSRSAPPYEIRAIGNPQTLENSLKMRGGVLETLQFWGIQVTLKTNDSLTIPAFKGTYRFEYAQPVKGGQV
ncbi:MAG: DUF881 domain-containing protein [Bacillota bacterium]